MRIIEATATIAPDPSRVSHIAPYVKDGINDCVVQGDQRPVNPDRQGTKVAAHYRLTVGPGESATGRLRLIGQAATATSEHTGTGSTSRPPWRIPGSRKCC
ncbi:glucosidase [Candidatus Methylomirabilis lanthanidiphila]|uniref:Glucosidase n=1 Tax=Candidatus Methylomirabilis lanthanidiphila TaxID=2211376 RepID=A0A564ZI58_9BACT|nr:hypothetical protein [Candidatus Methylomirabilis lanthanidiphila]VUZ84587.1 glucosidase [Candidatus Methylomirabilis lanthanidiphila]